MDGVKNIYCDNVYELNFFSYFAAHAGFMSGISGLESVPGPELPQIDFLKRFNGLNFQTLIITY